MGKKRKPIYDDFAVRYSLWAQTRGQAFYEDALSFLPPSTEWALDAGCGPGILSLQLADCVNHVVGLDISYSMIALAKKQQTKLKKGNIDFIVADLSIPPFKEGSFDFIATYNTVRFGSIESKIIGLCRLLKPCGRMIVHENIIKPSRITGEFPIWPILDTLMKAPRYAFSYNLRTTWSILSYRLNPKWIRYLWKSKKFTPNSFQDIYSRLLPGCRFKEKAWKILVFWEAPETSKRD